MQYFSGAKVIVHYKFSNIYQTQLRDLGNSLFTTASGTELKTCVPMASQAMIQKTFRVRYRCKVQQSCVNENLKSVTFKHDHKRPHPLNQVFTCSQKWGRCDKCPEVVGFPLKFSSRQMKKLFEEAQTPTKGMF